MNEKIHQIENLLKLWEEFIVVIRTMQNIRYFYDGATDLPIEGPLLHALDFRDELTEQQKNQPFDRLRFMGDMSRHSEVVAISHQPEAKSHLPEILSHKWRVPEHLWLWKAAGRPVFDLSADLQDKFAATSLKSMAWFDLISPVPAFAVVLGRPLPIGALRYDAMLVSYEPGEYNGRIFITAIPSRLKKIFLSRSEWKLANAVIGHEISSQDKMSWMANKFQAIYSRMRNCGVWTRSLENVDVHEQLINDSIIARPRCPCCPNIFPDDTLSMHEFSHLAVNICLFLCSQSENRLMHLFPWTELRGAPAKRHWITNTVNVCNLAWPNAAETNAGGLWTKPSWSGIRTPQESALFGAKGFYRRRPAVNSDGVPPLLHYVLPQA